jgi:hypothetical protein
MLDPTVFITKAIWSKSEFVKNLWILHIIFLPLNSIKSNVSKKFLASLKLILWTENLSESIDLSLFKVYDNLLSFSYK